MCVGSVVYFSLPFEPAFAIAFGLFVLALVVWWLALRVDRALLRSVVGFGVATGFLAGKVATVRVAHPVIETAIGPVMVEGWVEEIEPGGKGARLRLLVHAIDGLEAGHTPKNVRVTHTSRLEVEAGRFCALLGRVEASASAGFEGRLCL